MCSVEQSMDNAAAISAAYNGYSNWDEEPNPVVLDNGSYFMKAGFGGDDAPRVVFPSIVGRPRRHRPKADSSWRTSYTYVGDAAQAKRGILKLEYPIKQGIITNWDHMQKLWHHTFYNELSVAPEEHAVLLTESPFNPSENREKMTQIMFETFYVPAMYSAIDCALSSYASGRTTSIVLDSSYDVTQIAPIYEGYTFINAIMKLELGGKHIKEYLNKLLSQRGYSFNSTAEQEIVRDMKEKLSYIAMNYEEELKNESVDTEYELPDGELIITLSDERFKCCEALFKPNIIDIDGDGIHELLYQSISKCNGEMRDELFGNIILNGGNTMFDGLSERLTKEMDIITNKYNMDLVIGYGNKYCSSNNNYQPLCNDIIDIIHRNSMPVIEVIAPEERKYSTWIGGSILSTLSTFEDIKITKREYNECGAGIVHRKCPV